ncbi:MAG: aminotransferase class V-fold PLP-dependent enzyme [Sphingomonas sp.]|jgi:selenocysteine lyase/cysteine desulfurase
MNPLAAGKAAPIRPAPDWKALRARFPLLARHGFINSCSYGLLSVDVEAAWQAYIADRHEHGSHWEAWVDRYEALRADFATLLGAQADEIAVTGSASAGINAVASAMRFDEGRDTVVMTDLEFPTNAQIWHAQAARGARIVQVAQGGNATLMERLDAAIDERTKIVAITHVCYRNGEMLDVAAIARLARERGAYVLIDGFQAVGTMAIDMAAIPCDFYVGGTLKYLLGTAGVAFLYARAQTTACLQPTSTGWFAQEDVHAMDHRAHTPAAAARRFESGTPPVPNIYAAAAGLAIIAEVGVGAIQSRIAGFTARIAEHAHWLGIPMATPDDPRRRGAMVALRSHDAPAMVSALHKADIVTSSRDGNLRLSPHFYNDEADIDRAFEAIVEHRTLML